MARNLVDRLEIPRRQGEEDGLPEHIIYRDAGCDLHPTCLTCPFERCRYDEPGIWLREARDRRDKELLAVRQAEGLTAPQLAARFDVSLRTVHRVLAQGRAAGGLAGY